MHLRSSSDFLFLFKDSPTVWVFNFTSFYFFNYFILFYFGWWIPWLPGLWTEVPCFGTTCGYPEALTTLAFWLSLIAYILPWNYLVHSHLKFLLAKPIGIMYWKPMLPCDFEWLGRLLIEKQLMLLACFLIMWIENILLHIALCTTTHTVWDFQMCPVLHFFNVVHF